MERDFVHADVVLHDSEIDVSTFIIYALGSAIGLKLCTANACKANLTHLILPI